jgi:hypothetical protein
MRPFEEKKETFTVLAEVSGCLLLSTREYSTFPPPKYRGHTPRVELGTVSGVN